MNDLELAADLVTRAGRLAAQMRREGVTTDQKSSISDVVTEADRAAELLVLEGLTAARPDDGVLGEEGAARPSGNGRRWIIDPVDGTYNFVAGLEWWCSALALVDGDDLVLGAIYHPATDSLYLGEPGVAATRNGEQLPPLPDTSLEQACVATYLHPPFLGDPVGDAFTRVVRSAATIRMLGSGSMDMAAVARGDLQLYCQHSVPLWDRLPGQALVEAVGGVARQIEAAGKVWTLIGAPSVVEEAASALQGD